VEKNGTFTWISSHTGAIQPGPEQKGGARASAVSGMLTKRADPMKCPKCSTDNLGDSTFCEECGGDLEIACPSCGAANRPTANFCRKCRLEITLLGARSRDPRSPHAVTPTPLSYTPKHLADKILTSRSALEGERKQVTVLFADVKSSMELAEQ